MLRIRCQRLTKPVRPIVSSKKLESLTIDAIPHHDQTDHRIVQQRGWRGACGAAPAADFGPASLDVRPSSLWRIPRTLNPTVVSQFEGAYLRARRREPEVGGGPAERASAAALA